MTHITQGRRLIAALKTKWHTYGDMQRLGISTSPQKRVMECLAHDERILKAKRNGLIAWRVTTIRQP
jgi:hypothetical protein